MSIHSHHNKQEAGFTLIEVVVTVALLGILATAVINGILFILQRDRAEAVASELAGWLTAVRRASERGTGCTVSIIPGSDLEPNDQVAIVAPVENTDVANPCGFPALIPLAGPAAVFQVSGDPVTTFTFTPRGTIFVAGNNNTPIDITINAVRGGSVVRPMRCVRISPPLGLIEVVRNSGGTSGRCPP